MSELTAEKFREELRKLLTSAENKGEPYIDINSGDLHSRIGRYPGPNHQLPNCCRVMCREMVAQDEVICGPESLQGANLTIRYFLPRKISSSHPELK